MECGQKCYPGQGNSIRYGPKVSRHGVLWEHGSTRDAGGGWGSKKRNKTGNINNAEPGVLIKIVSFPSYLLGSQ